MLVFLTVRLNEWKSSNIHDSQVFSNEFGFAFLNHDSHVDAPYSCQDTVSKIAMSDHDQVIVSERSPLSTARNTNPR
jgi:hypothetical protein